jgi:methyl-accepting chemotaxis protein
VEDAAMGLLAYVRKRSLQTKSILSLSIIGSLTLLGMLLGFLCTKTVAADYERMLASNARFELLLTRIMARMNQLSRDEYAYIQNRDAGILQHREHTLQHIFDTLKELALVDQSIIPKDDLKAFEGRIQQHQDYFKIIAQHLTEEGNAESGFLGELRKAAHSAEAVLKGNRSSDQPKVMVSYLMIRRHEKDYLARRDTKYIDKLDEEIGSLRSFLGKSVGFNSNEKAAVFQSAETYRSILRLMHIGYNNLMAQKAKQEEGLQYIDDFMSRLSVKVQEENASRQASLQRLVALVNLIFLFAAVTTLLIIVLSVREFSAVTRSLAQLSQKLYRSGQKNLQTSKSLQSASEKTSAAATEQASAIQETVASINEISAIIDKSVGNANLSAEKADLSYHITAEGKQAVNAMRETMLNIREAMGAMIGQNNQANQRMQTILAVIEKIVERTQVINDIVFQTRLLAFNASVEAARAGEQGKGFAVVAEEVGNLARMSGEASKAITALLQDSRQEVLVIIEESRQQSTLLTEKVKEKVDTGVQIATRCDEILNEVVDHVGFVKTLMGEIASASQEEASGIHNITIAMNELDQTTALNSDMAHQTMSISTTLSQESAALHASVDVLSRIVMGDANVGRKHATRNDGAGAHYDDDSVFMAA